MELDMKINCIFATYIFNKKINKMKKISYKTVSEILTPKELKSITAGSGFTCICQDPLGDIYHVPLNPTYASCMECDTPTWGCGSNRVVDCLWLP